VLPHLGHEEVIELPVGGGGLLLLQVRATIEIGEVLLAGRSAFKRIGARRSGRDLGQLAALLKLAELLEPILPPKGDVMRVEEGSDDEPWLRIVARTLLELTEQLADLNGGAGITYAAGGGALGAVRIGTDLARESEFIEAIGLVVERDALGVGEALRVIGQEGSVGAGDEDVLIGEMPLATVVGLVAAFAEVLAECGNGVGIEPIHV
jgi:hypothetical protein